MKKEGGWRLGGRGERGMRLCSCRRGERPTGTGGMEAKRVPGDAVWECAAGG